jgi:energy-coupling factor transporter transmembrane protein EcfT
MILASSYPLLEVFWTVLIFFAFVVWIWILFIVFADLFRRRDVSGWIKVLWIVFIIVLPYLGVFVYVIAEHRGISERSAQSQRAAKREFDDYVRSAAGASDPASQIAQAKELLDKGTITQGEFDQIKQRAVAGS